MILSNIENYLVYFVSVIVSILPYSTIEHEHWNMCTLSGQSEDTSSIIISSNNSSEITVT